MTQTSDSKEEHSMPEDGWSALGDTDRAAVWRGLENVIANTAKAMRTARAQLEAGKLDTIADPNELLREARRALETIASQASPDDTATIATLADLATGYWNIIAERSTAASTGIGRLDDVLGGGLLPKRLVALLGAPGMGKTALSNQIAEHLANAGRPVLYLTTEDTPQDLLCKTIARLGSIPFGTVQRGDSTAREKIAATLAEMAHRQSAERLLYTDAFRGITDLQTLAAKHFARYADCGHGLLIVDYLQRIARRATGAQGQELRLAVSAFTDQLRELSKALDCTVLALVSQNRSAYGGKNGSSSVDPLASAKESGDLEYGADVLMVLGKDEDRSSPILSEPRILHVVKNRQGEADKKIRLDWAGVHQRFTAAAVEAAR